MKIILLKDVPKLGRRYEVKNVSDGYALNLLIPKGSAVAATPEATRHFDVERKKIEAEVKVQEDLLAKNIKSLDGVTITVTGKANDKGHLFAGLHQTELAKELNAQADIQVSPSFIQLEHPIKEVGEHMIEVKVGGKSAKFKVVVVVAK